MTKTILCADDSVTMQTVAQITFSSNEWEYVGARSADDALVAAREARPDLILADTVMPDRSGYDLCQAVKSDPELKHIPVVMMCGNSSAWDADRGARVGADGHVTKPWDTQQMLDKVGELLENVAQTGVAAPADGAAAAKPPVVTPPRKPTPPPMPMKKSPPPRAATPPPVAKGEPPRSMTLMGMPSLKMPPGRLTPEGVTSIETEPGPPPRAVAVQPAPTSAPAVATDLPKPTDGQSRPPMVKGTPTKRFSYAAYARKASPEELAEARASARQVAASVGHDLSDTEASALLKLSKEVVERIVWEAVPELAEAIIRENLDKLSAKS